MVQLEACSTNSVADFDEISLRSLPTNQESNDSLAVVSMHIVGIIMKKAPVLWIIQPVLTSFRKLRSLFDRKLEERGKFRISKYDAYSYKCTCAERFTYQ